jgi:hypothetical protein
MLLHTALNATGAFGNTLKENTIDGLLDSTITIDIDELEDDYSVHDEIRLNGVNGPLIVETGLTAANQDEDWKADVFMPVPKASVGYYYVFDDDLEAGNYIANATSNDPITIEFLGKKLDISNADADSITVTVGEEKFLSVDESVVVAGKTVKLLNVGTGGDVIVSVDGVQETVSGTETVNGLKVKVKETFESDTKAERSATLIIGTDATKSYNDGDAYIGEDEDDPEWVWDLSGLAGTDPVIGILNDNTKDNPDDNPPKMGEAIILPNNYVTIKLDSYTEKDYQKYTIETSTEEICNSTGSTIDSSLGVIHIEGSGDDDSFAGTIDTDELYLGINSSNSGLNVFKYDKDATGCKILLESTIANSSTAIDIGYNIDFQDTDMDVKASLNAAGTSGNITLVPSAGSNLIVYFERSANNDITYLGDSDGDTTTANDLLYGATDISGWEEDTRAQDGIIIKDPDAHLSGDSFEFEINGDEADFRANVIIAGPGAVTGGGTSALVITDAKVDDYKATKNLIVVGGSAVNTVAAELVKCTACRGDAWQAATGIGPDMAMIKLFSGANALSSGQYALLVAGYDAKDTQAAAKSLMTDKDLDATLKVTSSTIYSVE